MAAAPSGKRKVAGNASQFTVQQRFYEREMPIEKQVVIGLVVEVTETAAYVNLLEYENKRGMIPFSELSKRRIRSISNHVKVGKQEVLSVMRIDETYIDLSKKDVSSKEKEQANERFYKAKTVVTMMRQLAAELDVPVSDTMRLVAWPLDRNPKYRAAYDAFKAAMGSEGMDEVLGPLALAAPMRRALEELIKIKMRAQVLTFRADINVTCYTQHGIDGVKAALLAGRAVGELEPKLPVSITVTAPPQYLIQTHTDNRELGMTKVHAVLDAIQRKIASVGGELVIEQGPLVSGGDGSDELKPEPTPGAESNDEEDD